MLFVFLGIMLMRLDGGIAALARLDGQGLSASVLSGPELASPDLGILADPKHGQQRRRLGYGSLQICAKSGSGPDLDNFGTSVSIIS